MTESPPNVLVIGIGNPDRGDDGIGPLVARTLDGTSGIEVALRSSDGLALLDDWAGRDAVICVDAAAPMGSPGRLHRVDLGAGELPPEPPPVSSHAFGLAEAAALGRTLGAMPRVLIAFAVEGTGFGRGAAIAPAVMAAVPEACRRIAEEAERLRGGWGSDAGG